MAISFSRPDPSSPAAVADAAFGTARRGFDQQEVRDFLRMVAAELARLQERERFLERELRASQSMSRDATASSSTPVVDEETVTRLLGEETTRILTTARESATQTRAKAEEAAARLLRETTDEANRQRQDAEIEAARRRSDAAADAEAELSLAKQQGREMVEEARAYRERVLSELARRREMAREQIDQLIHGRDRLVQAFERARLVASDVVAELAPLTEPDEYVDLSPTTGPVPLTVPAGQLGDHSSVAGPFPGELDDDDDNPFVIDSTGGHERPAVPDDAIQDDDRAVEAVDDADVTIEPADEPTPDAATADADADAGVDEPPEAPTEADPTTSAATNVLAFARPNGPAVPGSTPAVDPEDSHGDEHPATEVDGIFAKLRAAQPEAEEPAADDADAVDQAEETPFTVREAAIVPLIVAGARKLKRRLADEQNEVLDALRRKEPVTSLDVLLPWESEQSQRYSDAITEELVGAAEAGATALGGARAIDLGPTGVLAPAREAMVEDLVEPLRERLLRSIEDADGDNDAVAKKVRAVYREWKTQRIDEHLDELFRVTYARAGFESIEAGTRVTWITDPDGPPSPDCEDNSLAGAVVAGDAFPTGHTCPPAHPGCRCLLRIAD